MKDATTLEKLTETILGSRQLAAKQLGTPPQFAVAFKFANGARAGAALSADGDAPEEVIREMMVTLALALRPVAFALSMESWAVMERGTDEQHGAMAAMRRRGAMPRVSQDPRRIEVVYLIRGDFEHTQEGMMRVRADGELAAPMWREVAPERQSRVMFTLVAFDDATQAIGAEKLNLTPDTLRSMARERLLSALGPAALHLMKIASLSPEQVAKMRDDAELEIRIHDDNSN